jgi:hypothetical protein
MVEEISDILAMVSPISLDGADRLLRRRLNAGDLVADLAGGSGGLLGQCLHFTRDHGKAAPGFAGTRGLEHRAEAEPVG